MVKYANFSLVRGIKQVRVITATAPGRCGIVGNPTDMYGGNVLSCTVQERAECRLESVASGQITLYNEDEEAVVRSSDEFFLRGDKLDIVRAALQFFQVDPAISPFTINLKTDIPMRAGMAGSTAMLAAIVGAIDAYFDLNMNPYAIAETMRKIEARIMGVVCGFQDQHMAVFGGLNYMTFPGKQELEQRDDEPLATIEPLASLISELPLILAHTGVQHHSGTVHKSPRERWLSGDELVRSSYVRIAELGQRGKRAIVEKNWQLLGELMNENHAIVAKLGGSGPDNDRLIEAARAAGAEGAKLAGAGGGGTIIALALDTDVVSKALLGAGADRLMTPSPSPGLQVSEVQV